ncbi:PSME3-interacting protein-like [Anneissia japonica]|uniref:PSME3-interacting protein-like n=1 Tax=Anneissia japonica TaxID=1529436 RepID=UPI00142587C6|nr:PSME3-interacting protein-like [Anneissia japonica]
MAESSGLSFKSFVSESELEEKRKKRQEEWEKVRTSEQPLEAPEEEYDPRSLYDRLQEQKDKKQAEYDEAHQFKNMVKGLEDEEAEFLDEVSNRQIELENKRWEEEINEIKEFRKARAELEVKIEDKQKPTGKPIVKTTATSSRKSQQSLLAGAVKRKRSNSEDKCEEKSLNANSKTSNASRETSNSESKNGGETMAKYVAVLPGLGVYSNSSESDSSSDSEIEVPASRCKAQCIIKKKK